MKRKNNLLVMAVLLALSAAGVAVAADTTPTTDAAKPAHPQLDANGDGFVDKAEAAKFPGLAAHFDALDTNHDGKLSKDELHAGWKQHAGEHGGFGFFKKLDTDGDGRVSKEEAKAADDKRFEERFDKMDANHDGFVDKSDFELIRKQHLDEAFAKADSNHDGVLSKAEFEAIKPGFDGERFHRGFGPHPGFGGAHDHRPPMDDDAPAAK